MLEPNQSGLLHPLPPHEHHGCAARFSSAREAVGAAGPHAWLGPAEPGCSDARRGRSRRTLLGRGRGGRKRRARQSAAQRGAAGRRGQLLQPEEEEDPPEKAPLGTPTSLAGTTAVQGRWSCSKPTKASSRLGSAAPSCPPVNAGCGVGETREAQQPDLTAGRRSLARSLLRIRQSGLAPPP